LPFGGTIGTLVTVDYREFRRLREGCISNLPPATDATVDSAANRLRNRLMSSARFAGVTVEKTTDPERLLVAAVRYRPGTPVAQVSSYLEAAWVAELRLPGLDAFNFHTSEGHVELESFTGDKASGYFLTLHLLAEEGSAEDFENLPPATADSDSGSGDAPKARRRWLRK
jgi:hypothetical protein